jgi:hypothetical protein
LFECGKVEVVLPHPNAWDEAQRILMRQAVVQAGLAKDALDARCRISFISEGEGSSRFCIERDLTKPPFK